MRLIDAHCHFDFPVFDRHRESVLSRAEDRGLCGLVIPGVERRHWARLQAVASSSSLISYCLGIHPWFVAEHAQQDLDALEEILNTRPAGCVALGECGLDRLHGSIEDQLPMFEAQVAIAGRTGFPLVIHSVRTHDEVGAALKRAHFAQPVLVHGFSGSFQQARKLVDLGCYLGIGGVITYARASKTRDTVNRLPLDALVLETDAPDMPPAGIEKGANSPENLPRILQELVSLRRESREEIEAALYRNVCRLYGWPVAG